MPPKKKQTLAPAADLSPLIQALLAGNLSDDAVIAHTRSQATAKYRPGVDKVGAGLAALRRANHAASLQNLDHAALYQELVNGSLCDENDLAIKLSNAPELNGAKKVTDTCLKITAPDGQGGVMTYLSDPDATREAVKGVKLAPAEDLGPLIQAALAGDLSDDAVIAHTRSRANANYQPGVDKVGAGLAALRRANHAASLQNLDHAALYQKLVNGSLCDENGLAIKLSTAPELNGAKKVTDTCLKITAPDGQGGVMTYLSDPDATRKAVKGVKLAPAEDLGPLIQAALAGDLSDDAVIAHTRSQVNKDYQRGVDKVGAGLAALRRANHAASLQNLNHAALYQELVNGSLCDENDLAIKLSSAEELNGAKKVTDTCLKITASNGQGGVMTYLSDPDATRKTVKGVKLAPAEDLGPLIQAALAGDLSDDAVIAHTRSQATAKYRPGVDKVGAGLAALRRANHAASLQNLDHATLYQKLVEGSLCDENGLAIKLSTAPELNGAKKVTDTCLKITAPDGQGGMMTYLSAPDATRRAVTGVKLAPAEDLDPLIQAALAGNLSDDAVIAHTRSQVNKDYQPGVDKVGAGLAALRRANHAASLQNLDHAALYQELVNGSLCDENGLAIKLSTAPELNGAKKVTDTCLKITAPDGQGGVMTYLSDPDATRKAVKGVKLAPAEDLGPLIQAALAGNLSDDAVIAHTRSQVNKGYQPGVDKVGAGLAALRRANHAASLQNLDHADLYQELVEGSLCDENGLAIKLSTAYELNGAKKVTDTCLKITAPNGQGGVMTYLSDPDATRRAVKGVKLAPAEDLGPLIQAALAGDLSDDAVIAHTRNQVNRDYQRGVDKVGAGLAALRRANHAASLQNLDHAALYQKLVEGSLCDENGLAIKLSSAPELTAAKKVTDTCLKITAPDGRGGVMTYLSDPDATRKAVKGVKLAPAEDLGPLIQAALAGNLSDDAVIAHTRSQVNNDYQPGVDKVGAGLAALRRANHAASLQNLDHAALYQKLVEGSLCDENGLAIKLSNAPELNGAKKVTDTCLKITAPDGQGGMMTYLSGPDATRKAVKGVKLAPAEDLGPLIQAALAGNLSDDAVIAHTWSQGSANYQRGVDKVEAGLAALRRANHAASLQNLDHAALYQELVNGSLCDENGLAIKLSNADELNGAKKVTDTCLKITAPNGQGGVMTYLSDPDAMRRAVTGVKLARAADLGPLIQAALAGNLSDDAVIAHTRSQVNRDYQPGVDKVGAGLAALRRANHAATLQNLDHAALYQELVNGSLCDENGLAIKLSIAYELNGAKKVTDTCLKITAPNGQGGVMTYLSDPDATRKAVKGVKLAPAEDLGPLIQAALAGDLSDDAVIAHTRSQVNKDYQRGVDKVGAGLAARRRANHAASLQNLDHAALYQELVNGSLCDENGLGIKLSTAEELNGAKKVTDTCLKITAPNGQGGMMTYLSDPDATRKAVKGVKNPWLLSSKGKGKGKGKNAAPEASATRTTSEKISGDEDNQEIDAESFRLVDIEQASGGKTIATSSDRKRKSKEFAQELAESSRGHLDKFPSDAFAERAAFSESAGFGNLSKRPRKIISYEQQLSPFPILEEYNEGIGDSSELATFERNTCSASEEQSALSSIGLQEARINHAETAVKKLKILSDFILNSDSYNALYDTIKRLITGENGKAIENEIKKILDKGPSKKAESVLLEKMVAETKNLEKTLKPGITSHEVGDGSNIFDVQVGNTLRQSPLSQEGSDFFVTQAAVSYPGTSHPISEALFPSPQSYMSAEFNAWMDLDNPVGQQISGSEEPLIQQRRETGESSQTIAQQVTFHGEADSYMLEALETRLNPVSPHLQTTLAEPSQKPLHYSPDDAGNILHSWPLTQIDTNSSMPHKTSPLLGTLGHQIGASEESFDPNSFLRDAESPETRQLPAQRVGSPAQAPGPYHWTNAPELIQDVSTNGAGAISMPLAISLVDHVKVYPKMNAQDLCRARPDEQRSLYVAQQQIAERGTRTPSPVKDPHLNAGPYPTGSPRETSGRGGR